jgi:hypothetical protein
VGILCSADNPLISILTMIDLGVPISAGDGHDFPGLVNKRVPGVAAVVKNVKPPRPDDKPRQPVYIDTLERGLALALIVSYGGTKAFRCITYVNGKAKSRKLGTYPGMSLKQARDLARAYCSP